MCSGRCVLISICVFQLASVLERVVFDFLGLMWGHLVADFIQMVILIIGISGTYQYRPKYLVVYGTWQFLWLIWNSYAIAFNLKIGWLARGGYWAYPLMGNTDATDWFLQEMLTCVSPLEITTPSPTTTSSAVDTLSFFHDLIKLDPYCTIKPIWFIIGQCLIQMFFALWGMLFTCCVVYNFNEDDDSFDFVGGFDGYNSPQSAQFNTPFRYNNNISKQQSIELDHMYHQPPPMHGNSYA